MADTTGATASTDKHPRKRPPARGTAAYARKRAVTACQVCRARRTKCDNGNPCSFCRKVGAKCTQSPTDLSAFDPASLRILERLDDLEELLRHSKGDQHSTGDRPNVSPNASSFLDLDNADQACLLDWLPPMPADMLHLTAFKDLQRGEAGQQSQLQPNWHSPESTVSPSMPECDVPSTNTFVDGFFENVHLKNPVLDETHTRHLVSRYRLHGFDSSAETCLVLLVYALGAITGRLGMPEQPGPGSSRYATAFSYFDAAQKRMGPFILKGGLVETQCFFLSGVFLMTAFNPGAAWRYFLQALSFCQAPLSQCLPYETAPVSTLSQAQQAVYWSTWKSEKEVRSLLRPRDFPTRKQPTHPPFFPTPPDPSPIEDTALNGEIARRQNKSWYFYLSEISLRRLSTRVTQELWDLQPMTKETLLTILPGCVMAWESQAEQWASSLSPSVSLSQDIAEDDVCTYVLKGHYVDVQELILWPFLQAMLTGKTLLYSQSELSKIAGYANRAVELQVQRLRDNRRGIRLRHHGTLLTMLTYTRSAMLLTYIARIQRDDQNPSASRLVLPDGWLEDVGSALHMNRLWQSCYAEAKIWADVIESALDRLIVY